ncbi:MAG: hypothetical protein KAJ91_01815 [Candidatus Aenigmarchaeota archaeon]|nr:hypothetical protein [Candidatus Aenigmarchaeota archaeon]MCK5334435.1 hypothetical protein [Candidatus Aenigmarchaeota archaeon]
MKKIEETPITYVEAKNILAKSTKDTEPGYEQKITLDYLRNFSKLSKKDIDSAKEELSQIDILKDHQIVTLLNILPEGEEEIKTIFMKERTTLEPKHIKAILDALAKIRPETTAVK